MLNCTYAERHGAIRGVPPGRSRALFRRGLALGQFLLSLCIILAASGTNARDAAKNIKANIALHRAAYQSGSVDNDHTGHLATDGSPATYWESEPNRGCWIAIDLHDECSVDHITLKWGEVYAVEYHLQISSDGLHPKDWKDVYASTNGRGGIERIAIGTASARHVRLMISAISAKDRGCVLSEFEVYGVNNADPPDPADFSPRADGSLVLSGGNWKLQNSMFVKASPANIAQAGFDDSNWIPAVVPGTVLGSYVAIGAVPDPWYGDQMSQISEDFFSRHDFWYRSQFVLPADKAGKRIWLDFDGINWKAEVFLNGKPIGSIDGAFIRGHFDITSTVKTGGTNCLAVLIHRVANPGPSPKKVTHKKLGSPTVNGDVLGSDSPTFVASAGWNWLPIIRGRNIGIWNEVRVETTGDVELIDPWVSTQIPPGKTNRADLTVQTELRNDTSQQQRGKIIGKLDHFVFEKEVTLAPGETKAVKLDPSDCPELSLANPRLWWPNGYGEQPLYKLHLEFESAGNISDRKDITFGIRTISYATNSAGTNRVLTLFVNGKRILCRGGNWGMDDGMLNCDAAGYDTRVRLHHDANLTMIRNWVGMVGRDAFYDACDRYGLLIWDDFWLANPGDGPNPNDNAMFTANARDKIRRVRGHPSLALYCGRNEGMPPRELDAALREAVAELDGTRHYISHSAAGTVSGFGPYDDQDPQWYFANRGQTFHSELGIVAVPPVESLRAMMPAESLWPINDMWAVHDYQASRMPLYTKRIDRRYGPAAGIEDYCRKAQMINMESAKAIYECLQAKQGGGTLVWMTQPAWPSLICQLYDYYFEPTAAYFGAKKGCEPLHVLWDSHTDTIKAANDTINDQDGLTVEGRAYDLEGNEVWHKSVPLNLPATSVKNCFAFEPPFGGTKVYFLKLKMLRGGKILSDNFYWSSGKDGSCRDLDKLPRLNLPVTVESCRIKDNIQATVTLKNPSAGVALMIRLKVASSVSGERILPVFYEDNYFSLLPGESRTVALEFANPTPAKKPLELAVEGWNILPQQLPIP